eukprot:529781-Rhodomonas_salina.3
MNTSSSTMHNVSNEESPACLAALLVRFLDSSCPGTVPGYPAARRYPLRYPYICAGSTNENAPSHLVAAASV